MVKPDGVQRGLVGEIIGRFERKGFKLKALQMRKCTREIAEEHYKDLKEKPFFKDLVDYILSGPVVAMVSFRLLSLENHTNSLSMQHLRAAGGMLQALRYLQCQQLRRPGSGNCLEGVQ